MRNKSPLAPPVIDPQYLVNEEDVDNYVKGIHLISVSLFETVQNLYQYPN